MINIIMIICIYFVILITKYTDVYHEKTLKGSITCIDKGLSKTCMFKNIFYYNKKWILYSDTNMNFNYCINGYAKKLDECWKVDINFIKQYKNSINYIDKIYHDISIPFQLTYSTNYGHALWDDLYSVYTSVVKSGYKNKPFNLVFNRNYKSTNYLNDILYTLQKFSKGKNIYLNKFINKTLLFKTLIVGSSHQCQRCVTLDYSLKYSREYKMTKIIRERMYNVFNLKSEFKYPIEGVIVHNKRFSVYEIQTLKKITTYYQNDKFLKLYYIDYSNITTFYQQLKLMSRIHIYISGPGTGLLNFPFIADPGVIIHLGHIHFGCPQYLEQYILEGSPHFKAIYYSPQKRMEKMNITYIISLINSAKQQIMNNKVFNVKRNDNLNDIGKLYVEICKEHKNICDKLLKEYDWGYGRCRGIWAENVVFFPSLYKNVPELKKIVELYNYTNNLGCKVGINHSKQKQCKKK